jgi:hypothetical protein
MIGKLLLDQRKQAKLQLLQDPRGINWDNLNNIRREASRYFRNEKREEVTRDCRKLYNEQFHNSHCSPSIIRIIKSRKMI